MTELDLADIIRPGTGRGLDHIILDELRKRTGIDENLVFKWAVSEMLCNSLDTDATEITIKAEVEDRFDKFTIFDNGSRKITIEDIKLILDFSNKASSKRGFLRVSRGYLGNALKCIFGYTFALAEKKHLDPPEIVINSHNQEYAINLKPDLVKQEIEAEIIKKQHSDNGLNAFIIKLPKSRVWTRGTYREDTDEAYVEAHFLLELIKASSMVNPTRKITYDLWGLAQDTLGEPGDIQTLRNETSILWYEEEQFTELFLDYIRAQPETQLKHFIALFRGFTSKKLHREILQYLNALNNHDSRSSEGVQFLPATQICQLEKHHIQSLYSTMRSFAKPISKRSTPKILGIVGEDQFKQVKDLNSWTGLKYTTIKDRKESEFKKKAKYPYLIELAIFDREPEDEDGLRLYQCVNFMASNEDIFSRLFSIDRRLGQVGIKQDSPVTIIIHLVCPVLEWMNYAKTYIGGRHIGELLKKAFNVLLPIPRKPKVYKPKKPKKPVSWVPSGTLGNDTYEARLRDFANELRAIDARRSKDIMDKFSSRGWCYLLENLNKIHKGEFNKAQRAINDCRKIGLLPIDFTAVDQDETRRFAGIHEASDPTISLQELKYEITGMLADLPAYTTDYWQNEEYYLMMCVEKGDIKRLFETICKKYHVPIVSSKGWPPIQLRGHIATLSRQAEERGLKPVLLLFYDHDPAGLKITNTFRKNLWDIERATGWDPSTLIIDRFGLNHEDIDKHDLTWIENLKTSSGRSSRDVDYIREYGRRKCELNALFKDDETLKIGIEICRASIEKYYGEGALERFKEKEKQARKSLDKIFKNPVWNSTQKMLDHMIRSFSKDKHEQEEKEIPELEIVYNVTVNERYYANCPYCGGSFDDTTLDIGRVFRCRYCNSSICLVQPEEGSP